MNLNLVQQVWRQHLHHVVPDVNGNVLSCANGREKNEQVMSVNEYVNNLCKVP